MRKREVMAFLSRLVGFLYLTSIGCTISSAQQAKKPFTLADEIGLTLFDDPNEGSADTNFSPDGNCFAVWTERGRSDLNGVEDSLRFYRSQDVKHFLEHPDKSQVPVPIWVFTLSGKEGTIIN